MTAPARNPFGPDAKHVPDLPGDPARDHPSPVAGLAAELERCLIDECLIALGLRPDGPARRWLEPVLRRPVRRMAGLLATFDHDVTQAGVSRATQKLLAQFVAEVSVRGAEHIPAEGPLLVAANHPGAYDGLVVVSSLGRDDLKLIASGVDLLRRLPAASEHMIFVSPEAHQRMTAVRAMLRHLDSGGAVLVMAGGLPDPDPDLEPGAEQALEAWSPSLELALRRVPGARVQVAIVSGVLAGACRRHPLTRLRAVAWEQRKLAAFLQVSQQLGFGRDFVLRPRVSFGPPLELPGGSTQDLRRAILASARGVLAAHLAAGEPVRSPSHAHNREG